MDYAVYVYDVSHIVLDNLQFMLSGESSTSISLGTVSHMFLWSFVVLCAGQGGRGFERFESQERALEQLRQFASAKNVHISLVVHPRKEQADTPLQMNSVFGTAKATQEADNVYILQALPPPSSSSSSKQLDAEPGLLKYLDVKKNRFDGRLGSVPLDFNPDTLVYFENDDEYSEPKASEKGSSQSNGNQSPSFTPQQTTSTSSAPAGSPSTTENDEPLKEENAFSILTK